MLSILINCLINRRDRKEHREKIKEIMGWLQASLFELRLDKSPGKEKR